MYVFIVSGSLKTNQDNTVKTIAPILKPINLEGQSCPSKAMTKFFTENINNIEIGIPNKTIKK